ncbi:transcriptional regulator [Actinoplanes cyaneus]|uniref:Transcriptional regulator n=1 Tax=Actinoplanes cyaneus TaxID=52696 RepID=A0A919LXX9_9ACTN|nr:transcriptional regulator [Actinoplanes cyaneus]
MGRSNLMGRRKLAAVARAIAEVQTPGRRRRSEGKQAAVLDAAQALFLAEGYEGTTVDAIAARAQVSKRTVYDHFGDKETIFLRVLQRVTDALVGTVRTAIDEELAPGRDLREALLGFGHRIVDRAFASSDYSAFHRLTSRQRPVPRLPAAVRDRPEQMLAERFAELAAQGALRASDPGVAARHFTALTIRSAQEATADRLDEGEAAGDGSPSAVAEQIIADGVDAFLRAYR